VQQARHDLPMKRFAGSSCFDFQTASLQRISLNKSAI
jgi:hypothetical protein